MKLRNLALITKILILTKNGPQMSQQWPIPYTAKLGVCEMFLHKLKSKYIFIPASYTNINSYSKSMVLNKFLRFAE